MIEILNPQLDSNYADYWGEPFPFQLENWRPIIKAGCYVPRWFQAPTNALQNMTAGQYVDFSIQLPAGSFILEIAHSFQDAGTPGLSEGAIPPPALGTTGIFTVQITDLAIDHQWFSNPMPASFFFKTSGRNGYILPKPYPIISPGNLRFEFWCTSPGYCEILLSMAIPQAKL